MAYSFQTKIAAHGYHVFKILVWSNAKQCDFVTVEIKTDKELKKIDTYCCAIAGKLPTNCLSVFGHFKKLVLKGLKSTIL